MKAFSALILLTLLSSSCVLLKPNALVPPDMVEMSVDINEKGEVEHARVISSTNKDFEEAALRSVRRYKYKVHEPKKNHRISVEFESPSN